MPRKSHLVGFLFSVTSSSRLDIKQRGYTCSFSNLERLLASWCRAGDSRGIPVIIGCPLDGRYFLRVKVRQEPADIIPWFC